MKKDLLVTSVSKNYSWTEIKNWIYSIKKTSYLGDILILAYNFESYEDPFLVQLRELDVQVIIPRANYKGQLKESFLWHSGMITPENANEMIHNVRLFHIWQYFKENNLSDKYKHVIFTDGRDVVFQTNPSDWLDNNLQKEILFPSEGVLYRDQRWNQEVAIRNYGPYVYEYLLKDSVVINVGTFACKAEVFSDLCIVLYFMSNNTGLADQQSFNILFNTLLKDRGQAVDYTDSWCLQIGAIVDSIDDISYIKEGQVCSRKTDIPYVLVHQYDRVPQYKHHFDSTI